MQNTYKLLLKGHCSYLYWFPSQDEEILSPHHHEAHEFMAQNLFNLICLQKQMSAFQTLYLHSAFRGETEQSTHLLDSNADSDRVDGALNQNFLFVITTDNHRLEEKLFTTPKSKKKQSTMFITACTARFKLSLFQ